ncbi:adenine-specific DNA-methyltransferase [Tepidamorphus gemmatus]|uniref:site-specific DNA-methyltransferase (adenine-specific) n=1 Tax=Tepidamorphus gemmatus TaxID=747076 RepID=A0A4R3MIY3_9HYPH|nr:DNA methyltransferase [Tepidamorphus gemmatus]TCT12364.1 adenine-specific DNA-methyltransferase [Tepidamorphus gemmatus]
MSRLTDLIARAKAKDPALGDELEREFRALASRRAFGLNFERHRPESVELPGRPIRRGDKVRILPPRGSTKKGDPRLWRVLRIEEDGARPTAHLAPLDGAEPEAATAPVEDLVVMAEFRDYIYPGLVSTGRVARGGDKPFHSVINGENFHVLEALTFTHRGRIDAIYIDPPYNTGARDWKYNNDYVEAEDLYRHSKWLAFMERRLKVAKELLNPENSVLIVTIDEKEYLRLGLLLEQTFPEADVEMVTSVISAKGAVRPGRFSRVEEHIFFVFIGSAKINWWVSNMLPSGPEDEISERDAGPKPIQWLLLRRREPTSIRSARPNQFYPIFVNSSDGTIRSIGDPIPPETDRHSVDSPEGTTALWPIKPDGTEMLWGLTPEVLRRNLEKGYVRINNWEPKNKTGSVQYLQKGTIEKIESGEIVITGYADDGSVQGHTAPGVLQGKSPKRIWNMRSHNAETGGTNLLSALLPKRRFPFPKSLYAVEDALRFFVADKPEAIILDFFAGSGTTAHAVMRLNRQDGGRRQCISVTNNEVAADEQKALRQDGLRPGDPDWEKWGICEYITKPRIEAAITGRTPEGAPIKGDYKFTDEFPMAEGFEENAEFFTLTYESPVAVHHNLAFQRIAPLLWLRAGARGRRIDTLPEQGWEVADTYGLLIDLDRAAEFCAAVEAAEGVKIAYVVTDDDRRFQSVARRLPAEVEPIRLYEAYLSNFRFSMGR